MRIVIVCFHFKISLPHMYRQQCCTTMLLQCPRMDKLNLLHLFKCTAVIEVSPLQLEQERGWRALQSATILLDATKSYSLAL